MTDLAIDLNPASPTYLDVSLSGGDLVTVSGTAAILQNILQTLKTYYGEWFLDNTVGVDYFGTILVKNPNQGFINTALIGAILAVPGVTQLTNYNFSANSATRQLSVTFTAQTTSGIVNYAGLI